VEKFGSGTLELGEILNPAIRMAEEGYISFQNYCVYTEPVISFPVSEIHSRAVRAAARFCIRCVLIINTFLVQFVGESSKNCIS
jgi:hypothetical protein